MHTEFAAPPTYGARQPTGGGSHQHLPAQQQHQQQQGYPRQGLRGQWDREQPAQPPFTGYGRGDLCAGGGPAHGGEWGGARSEGEVMTEHLHRQAQLFPPPPPPTCPAESRRQRAELWSASAAKWDITGVMPPPPRSPLEGMDEEFRRGLAPLSLVPYKGDQWLRQSEHWFAFVQKNFRYPPENAPALSSFAFVSECCHLDPSQ